MKKKREISLDLLHSVLLYTPWTGKLWWKFRPRSMFQSDRVYKSWNTSHAGKEAFTCTGAAGYHEGTVLKTRFYAHRVCWALHYNEWPKDEIDHVNGVTVQNQISNLREATRKENTRNTRKRKHTTSQFLGVCWAKNVKKWHAQITVNLLQVNLGYFNSETQAAVAYDNAAQECFGAYANCNFGGTHPLRGVKVVGLAPTPVAEQRMHQIINIMRRVPAWAEGLPLDAEGMFGDRMSK